jgi:creatinine amidohydrolase/Fe(II)-dependent formamide hydrolase-like protein
VWANGARELHIRFGLLAAAPLCSRLGLPSGLYDRLEAVQVIHGGDIETALRLELRPDHVHMVMAGSGSISMPKAPSAMPHRCEGRATADHQLGGFTAWLRDVTAFPLTHL